VTSFEYQLHPVGPVLGGMVLYEMRRAREVLRFYREFAHACPDELSTMAAFLTAPNGNPIWAVVACHCGASAEGERAFKPFRTFGPPMTDLVGPMPYVAMQCLFDEGWPPGAPALLEVEFSAHGERRRIEMPATYAAAVPSPMTYSRRSDCNAARCRTCSIASHAGVRVHVFGVDQSSRALG
jgi:hypothetical protein